MNINTGFEGVKFKRGQNEFSNEIKRAVNQYFKERGIDQKGNWKLYLKSGIFMFTLPLIFLTILFAGFPFWVNLILWALLGVNFAGIGFNVMHDASHGSFSSRPWVNKVFAGTLDLMGGCAYIWKQKHGVNHHTFTNIDGMDDDLDIKPWIRTNPSQKKFWFHKYQHYYSPFLYGLTYLFWVFVQDYRKYFSGKIAGTKMKKMGLADHFGFWAGKIFYYGVFIVLPIYMLGLFQAGLGYLTAAVVCGWLLAMVFQMAHVVEDTQFPLPDEDKRLENEWMIHQLLTTANFSTRNKVVSWFTGGLNYQVEHHLFPNISHVHYPGISKLIKEICREFNVPYNEYPGLRSVVTSHFSHLRTIGRSN